MGDELYSNFMVDIADLAGVSVQEAMASQQIHPPQQNQAKPDYGRPMPDVYPSAPLPESVQKMLENKQNQMADSMAKALEKLVMEQAAQGEVKKNSKSQINSDLIPPSREDVERLFDSLEKKLD